MSIGLLAATILQTFFIFAFVFILVPFRTTLKNSIFLFGGIVVLLCAVTANVSMLYGTWFLYQYGYFVIGIPSFLAIFFLSKAQGVRFIFIAITAMIFHQMLSTLLMVFRVVNGGSFSFLYFLLNILLYGALMLGGFRLRKDFHQIVFTYRTEFCCLCPILLLLFGLTSMFAPITDSETVDLDLLIVSAGIYLLIVLLYLYIGVNFHSLSRSLQAERDALTLRHQINDAQEHLSLLRSFQERAAVQRHDLRHHLTMIEDLLDAGQTQQLRDYLVQIREDIEKGVPLHFCQNEATDLLLSSFFTKAQKEGVTLTVNASLPHSLPVSSTELCALLSNALENAITAAAHLMDSREKTVRLHVEISDGKLLILVENPYAGTVRIENGLPRSSLEGHGFGVRSIAAIAEKYGGLYSFEADKGVFTLRVAI